MGLSQGWGTSSQSCTLPDHSIKNIFAIWRIDALVQKNHACTKKVTNYDEGA